MKSLPMLTALAALAFAPDAHAVKVLNLDRHDHVVAFESAGSVQQQTVRAQRSVWFQNMDGMVSLVSAQPVRHGQGTLQHDGGLLRGMIGNRRNQRIPVGPHDELVIWSGGEMSIQRRIKMYR